MTAPPPMPNRPASNPVTTPPTTMASASQSSSLNGTPRIILPCTRADGLKLRGDVRQFPIPVQDLVRDKRERGGEEFGAGLRRRRSAGEMPPVSARPGHGAEQAVEMSGDGVQPCALRQLAFDIGHERGGGLFRRDERRRLSEHQRIDRDQPPRLLIGGAAHHDAVEVLQMLKRLLDAGDTAVEHDGELRMLRLEPVDARVIERRHFAILFRRQALRAWTISASARACSILCAKISSAASGSCSSMPMRHFTVTGIDTAAFIAATQSPTSAGSAIRQAPKRPSCTRSDGQPALRLISSKPRSAPIRAQAASARGSEPPSCNARGCSAASKRRSRARSPCSTAPVVSISV